MTSTLRILRAPIETPEYISPEIAASCDRRYADLRKIIDKFLSLSTEMKLTLKLMVLGVAFPDYNGNAKIRVVFSHEGDELGKLPTFQVEHLIHLLRRCGLQYTKIGQGFTYGF